MRNCILILFMLLGLSVKSQKVYKTPNGAKYHLASCRMVDNVSNSLTVKEAIKEGLTPCKICKPPIVQGLNSNQVDKSKGTSKNTVQCRGITKAGTRCRHNTSIANGYCFQHNPDKK